MKIICLFGERKSVLPRAEPGLIELMVAWDEYCVDANSEGFEEDCKKAKESWGSDLAQWREVHITIDENKLQGLFETGKLHCPELIVPRCN